MLVVGAGLLLAVATFVGGLGVIVRPAAGSTSDGHRRAFTMSLVVEECFDVPPEVREVGTDDAELLEVDLIPCEEPHDHEVISAFDHEAASGVPYPGFEELTTTSRTTASPTSRRGWDRPSRTPRSTCSSSARLRTAGHSMTARSCASPVAPTGRSSTAAFEQAGSERGDDEPARNQGLAWGADVVASVCESCLRRRVADRSSGTHLGATLPTTLQSVTLQSGGVAGTPYGATVGGVDDRLRSTRRTFL